MGGLTVCGWDTKTIYFQMCTRVLRSSPGAEQEPMNNNSWELSYVQFLAQASPEFPGKQSTGHMVSKYMPSWMTRNMEELFGWGCLLTS